MMPFKKTLSSWPVLAVVFMLQACSSSPKTEFYTLEPVAETPAAPRSVKPIALGDFELPEELNRLQIVRPDASNQVNISDIHRWAAPLDDMSHRVLTSDLERLLAPQSVIVAENAEYDSAANVISIQADRFEGSFDGRVTLDVHWNVVAGNPQKTILRSSEHITEQAADGSYPAMVTAMDKALADLANAIAIQLPAQ